MIAGDESKALIHCLTRILSLEDWRRFFACWCIWRTGPQTPPQEPWRTWLFLGGRGAGKTRAGAEWVRDQVERRGRRRIALIGPTFHDVREVMIEGPSGLRRLGGARPSYQSVRRRLVWPNGAEAHAFSAADPEGLRGPQFDAAWADEFCAWDKPEETWRLLSLGLRLGRRPQAVVTTTPKPIAALRALMARRGVAITRGATRSNAHNLAAGFIEEQLARWGGTTYCRQELEGEVIDDPDGALWSREDLHACRLNAPLALERVVVAIDPPAGTKGDSCGIVAAGAYEDENRQLCGVVLADASVRGLSPIAWAGRAVELARSLGAQWIVAEANNGGDMVRTVINEIAPWLPVKLAFATRTKRARAEPVAMLYAQRRVAHAGTFPALEDEMCTFGAPEFAMSPDRLDALVWALTDLLLDPARPRVRTL